MKELDYVDFQSETGSPRAKHKKSREQIRQDAGLAMFRKEEKSATQAL